ncbi:MAG: 4-amino-4-deoxy-L-arabinose transferase, partial [Clostridium sp.]|nr:4-amino-4-deoxy-L-arabinose transferase [Clostridium sp.]
MEALVKKIKENKILLSLLLVHFIINISYLTKFPFVHSDESWLSGLSRNIMEKGDYSVTETFFDLYPRYPHAIKAIFHTIQILFIKIFGYRIFSVRFMSLIFSMFIIYFFYKLSRNILKDSKIAFISL